MKESGSYFSGGEEVDSDPKNPCLSVVSVVKAPGQDDSSAMSRENHGWHGLTRIRKEKSITDGLIPEVLKWNPFKAIFMKSVSISVHQWFKPHAPPTSLRVASMLCRFLPVSAFQLFSFSVFRSFQLFPLHWWLKPLFWAVFLALAACSPEAKKETTSAGPASEPGVLATVGSIYIRQSDIDHHLKEHYGGRADEATRRKALEELTQRAQHAQAALDAKLDQDPTVRAEFARILTNIHREKVLAPQLKAIAEQSIPESRLRELYQANESRFRANEKRQVAVLWLNPGGDPERTGQYRAKLESAREWVSANDLKDHPEQGFSVLSVDHSEHQASRYKGGVIGWLESTGGIDPWTKAVAEIAFSLEQPGEVSQVVARPEGLFLIRCMAKQPAILRPFESVSRELEQAEKQRLCEEAEADFQKSLDQKYLPHHSS